MCLFDVYVLSQYGTVRLRFVGRSLTYFCMLTSGKLELFTF